jgi:hypothetical protein
MWIYYSINNNDTPMIVRSSTEIFLLTVSAIYIIKNKFSEYKKIKESTILPV